MKVSFGKFCKKEWGKSLRFIGPTRETLPVLGPDNMHDLDLDTSRGVVINVASEWSDANKRGNIRSFLQ